MCTPVGLSNYEEEIRVRYFSQWDDNQAKSERPCLKEKKSGSDLEKYVCGSVSWFE